MTRQTEYELKISELENRIKELERENRLYRDTIDSARTGVRTAMNILKQKKSFQERLQEELKKKQQED